MPGAFMKKHFTIIICLLVCLSQFSLSGQSFNDTLRVENTGTDSIVIKQKKGSIFTGKPGKAMLMSLVIPGTGQIYNKSYLRVPFIWGAVGGMGYLVSYNTKKYNCLKEAYIASIDNLPYEFPAHCSEYDRFKDDPNTLKLLRDEANKNRQLSIIGFSLVWLANGIDAFVNAHLKSFNIDENLSINIRSKVDNDPNSPMRMGLFVNF
jgi:hypothetical protein